MTISRVELVRPGYFGVAAAADGRRHEFDLGNEVLVANKVPVDFVFIGDSITHMWELNAYFGRGGRFIVNRGIGGDISNHVLRRFDADVIQLKPKVVVIKIGINNFWALDGYTLFDTKSPEQLIPGLVNDIKEMVLKAVENEIVPIICSLLPTNMPRSGSNRLRNESILSVNRELRKLADELGLVYVDYHSRMVKEEGAELRDGLADDGIHPHILGYDIMAECLREACELKGIQI